MNWKSLKWVVAIVVVIAFVFAAGVGVGRYLLGSSYDPISRNPATERLLPRTPENLEKLWTDLNEVVLVDSREQIPGFPESIPGFVSKPEGIDFWGDPFKTPNSIRVFAGTAPGQTAKGWNQIDNGNGEVFPKTMNSCGSGIWLMRWRSSNDDILVAASVGYIGDIEFASEPRVGRYGYMKGNNCEEPLFRFGKAVNGNPGNLVDVLYEVKFFEVRP